MSEIPAPTPVPAVIPPVVPSPVPSPDAIIIKKSGLDKSTIITLSVLLLCAGVGVYMYYQNNSRPNKPARNV